MCQLSVDLPEVHVIGIDKDPGQPMRVHVETPDGRPGCPTCGVFARSKDRDVVELVDLPSYGRPRRLIWHKRRWWCADADCTMKTFTEVEHRIANSAHGHDRPGRPLGDRTSGSPGTERERDRHRTRLRLAHGEQRRRQLRRGPGRRARPLRRRQRPRTRRGALRASWDLPPPGVLDHHRRRGAGAVARCRPWQERQGTHRMARGQD
jgi:hypothetical protein